MGKVDKANLPQKTFHNKLLATTQTFFVFLIFPTGFLEENIPILSNYPPGISFLP